MEFDCTHDTPLLMEYSATYPVIAFPPVFVGAVQYNDAEL